MKEKSHYFEHERLDVYQTAMQFVVLTDEIVEHLQHKLGVGFNEVTPDGKFCLKEGECMGCCGGAPLLHVNNSEMHEFLTTEKVDALINELNKG